ncbi:MAG TPA: class I SAM-dependent methyltransferase [Vicinamibacteria bacterium]|nr:class I SAM-dependent methyltransferase [Vicinamibacteria bacterium]
MSAPLEDADVETASAGYARRFDSPVGGWMLATQAGITADLLRDLPGASVLDVGGGHGQIAPVLADRGHRVSVLASSPAAVATTLRPTIDSGRVNLLTGDLRNPPVDAKSMDAVVSYRLLAHARDLRGLVAGLCRPARVAVIVDYATTRSFNAAADLLFSAKKRVERNTRPFLVMSDAEVSTLFRQNGFHLRERRPQFFWPMALHRALKSPGLSRGLEAAARALGLKALFGSPVIARFDRD